MHAVSIESFQSQLIFVSKSLTVSVCIYGILECFVSYAMHSKFFAFMLNMTMPPSE